MGWNYKRPPEKTGAAIGHYGKLPDEVGRSKRISILGEFKIFILYLKTKKAQMAVEA